MAVEVLLDNGAWVGVIHLAVTAIRSGADGGHGRILGGTNYWQNPTRQPWTWKMSMSLYPFNVYI